jgi:hypothetical protein
MGNNTPTATLSGNRFQINIPGWFRNATAVSQSAANAQAGTSSQANSAETVSSGPGAAESVDTPGETSRPRHGFGTGRNNDNDEDEDDDGHCHGDRIMYEAHHEDLD